MGTIAKWLIRAFTTRTPPIFLTFFYEPLVIERHSDQFLLSTTHIT
jgi:hypothetical protein